MEVSRATVEQEAKKFYLGRRTKVSSMIDVKRVNSGSETQVWIVDGEWVFRFIPPPVPKAKATFECEYRLFDCLKETALKDLICPILQIRSGAQDMTFGIYPKAKGYSIEEAPELMTKSTENDLVILLQTLASFDLQLAHAVSLSEGPSVNIARLREDAISAWEIVQQDTNLGNARKTNVRELIPTLQPCSNHPMVLLHGDLKGEHLFIDHEDGRVTSAIDWSDSCIGCPSIDIAGLAISIGARKAARVGIMAGYTSGIVEEGISLARCNAILQLATTLRGDDDSPYPLVRKQLLMAFQAWSLKWV